MRQRAFGRTGLHVSEVVFGGGNVGGLIIQKDDATRREAIRRALAGGINWFDTAAMYGNGKSEEALGWLLLESGANPYLSTKFQLDVSNLTDIPGQIEQRFRESLARLKRSSVDLLQLHNRIGSKPGGRVLAGEHILGKDGVADDLERLREKGLIRHMGITAIGETDSVCEVIRSGRFDSAQVYYNLLNPSAGRSMPKAWTGQNMGGLIEACRAHGVAVHVVGVAGLGSGKDAMRRFAADTGITAFANLDDDRGEVWRRFDVTAQEYFVVIDRDGKVVHRGGLSGDQLRERVAALAG